MADASRFLCPYKINLSCFDLDIMHISFPKCSWINPSFEFHHVLRRKGKRTGHYNDSINGKENMRSVEGIT
jgi:hypothetical protein